MIIVNMIFRYKWRYRRISEMNLTVWIWWLFWLIFSNFYEIWVISFEITVVSHFILFRDNICIDILSFFLLFGWGKTPYYPLFFTKIIKLSLFIDLINTLLWLSVKLLLKILLAFILHAFNKNIIVHFIY